METLFGIGILMLLIWFFVFRKRMQTHPGSRNWAEDVDGTLIDMRQDTDKIDHLVALSENHKARIDRLEMNIEMMDVILKERSR